MNDKPAASRTGLWVVLAIVVLGLVFVGGLYLTAWTSLPAEYRRARPGFPPRRLQVVSWNLDWTSDTATAARAIAAHAPDLVLLQRVTRAQAQDLARALDMRSGGELSMFYSQSNPGTSSEPGNAILARWPLYQGREISHPTPRGFGIFAEPVIDQRRFVVGSIDLAPDALQAAQEIESLRAQWQKEGGLPLIFAGDFGLGMLPPALEALGSGEDRMVVMPGVVVNDWGEEGTGKHKLIWAVVSSTAMATLPASRP